MSLPSPWTTSWPAARRRRADPPPPAGALRPRRLLRVRSLRDAGPVPAAPLPPPEAAGRGRAAGPGAGGRQRLFPAARRGRLCPAVWPACRRTTRCWPPTAARPPGWLPNGRAWPPTASAAQGADWDEMRALGLPAAAIEAALLALVPPSEPAGCWTSAPAPDGCWNCWRSGPRRRSASMPAATCWPWPVRGWRSAASAGHCAVRQADMYRLPLPRCRLRCRGPADGAALRRRPGRRAGRSGARAAAGRAADGDRPRARMTAMSCWTTTRIAGPASTMRRWPAGSAPPAVPGYRR